MTGRDELPGSRLIPSAGAKESVPSARLWLALILLAAVALRLAFIAEPWSGLALDFHSHFGAWAVGEPAERFATDGFGASGFMPINWSVTLADGSVVRDVYAHHPALYTILVGLSLKLFGLHEWAVRLVPFVFSMLAIFATWRFVTRWFGERAGLFAAALLATAPYLAWYGMLAWTEGALIWIAMGQLMAYARWLEEPRTKFIVQAALWQLLAGLFDWSGAFLMVGIALHALVYRVPRLGLRRCLVLLALPTAFLLAALVHDLHMRSVMPAAERARDTQATLSTVTTLTTSVGFWLQNQVRFAWRFLGAPGFILAAVGLAHAALLAARRRLNERDALALVALVPGLLYVGLFPQRSINHDFFLMLALPGIAVLAAGAALRLAALVVPVVTGERAAKRRSAFFVFLLVITSAVATARTLKVASARESDQMPRIAAALEPILKDPSAVILTHIGRGMALPFYSKAEIVHSVDTPKLLEQRLGQVVEKLQAGKPAYFLFDLVSREELASATARALLGDPSPEELPERLDDLVQATPKADLDGIFESLLPGSLPALHQALSQRFPARLVTTGEYGIFEVFELGR